MSAVRVARHGRVLLLAGATTRYAIEPRGEYVFGTVERRPMRARRGPVTQLVRPGELVAWDPAGAHAGTAVDGPWLSRLMIVEAADLTAITSDGEGDPLSGVAFPDPVIDDPRLAVAFTRVHAALEDPASSPLERDTGLAELLLAFARRSPSVRRDPPRGDDRHAVALALDYLGDRLDRNVTLDELAAAAGTGKFRLVRLFRERVGMPPHAWQLAQRLRRARRLLEAGTGIAETAAATGFADQSHLHRHFQRGLGFTPGAYRDQFRNNVQYAG